MPVMNSSGESSPRSTCCKRYSHSAVRSGDWSCSGSTVMRETPVWAGTRLTAFFARLRSTKPVATSFSMMAARVAGVPSPFRSASSGISSLPAFSIADRRVSSDTFCQGCLRTFFAVIQNQTLDFVAHGFFARFTEMDFDAVGGLSDFSLSLQVARLPLRSEGKRLRGCCGCWCRCS